MIKIVSLNIWNGGKLFDNLVSFLREQNADIVMLQEVYNGSGSNLPREYRTFEEFKNIFPNYHSDFVASFGDRNEYGDVDRGNAIFSKFPILSSKTTFFDLPYRVFEEQKSRNFEFTPRALQHSKIQVDGTILNVFNHHGIWGTDGLDNPRRIEMSKVIVKEIEGKNHVILAGDFNLNPDTKTIRMIEKHLNSVFKKSLMTTFNMKRKTDPGFATAPVDMMFVSSDIKIVSKECPLVDVSDHLPLVVEIEV